MLCPHTKFLTLSKGSLQFLRYCNSSPYAKISISTISWQNPPATYLGTSLRDSVCSPTDTSLTTWESRAAQRRKRAGTLPLRCRRNIFPKTTRNAFQLSIGIFAKCSRRSLSTFAVPTFATVGNRADSGLWTLDSGLWTFDFRLSTLDFGLWTIAPPSL